MTKDIATTTIVNERAFSTSTAEQVHFAVSEFIDRAIDWYTARTERKRSALVTIKFGAAALGCIGFLTPIAVLSGIGGGDLRYALYGYLFLGGTVSLLIIDLFFGVSSSYVRHLASWKSLEGLKMELSLTAGLTLRAEEGDDSAATEAVGAFLRIFERARSIIEREVMADSGVSGLLDEAEQAVREKKGKHVTGAGQESPPTSAAPKGAA